jgi:hypothetical protein
MFGKGPSFQSTFHLFDLAFSTNVLQTISDQSGIAYWLDPIYFADN